MTLEQFLFNIDQLLELHPDAINYQVIFSKDDEGNEFHKVFYTPSVGKLEGEDYDQNSDFPDSICIN